MVEFLAECAAQVSKNDSYYLLLRLQPPRAGHLMGDLPKELGEFERDAVYHITIRKMEPK